MDARNYSDFVCVLLDWALRIDLRAEHVDDFAFGATLTVQRTRLLGLTVPAVRRPIHVLVLHYDVLDLARVLRRILLR